MVENGTYRHFKGTLYNVIGTAQHTESGETVVVYCAAETPETLWARPEAMWHERVVRDGYDGPRFVRVTAQNCSAHEPS